MTLRELRAILVWKLGIARWLFIHIPKNAGVSIAKHPELANSVVRADPYFHISRDYTRDLARVMAEQGEHHGFQHARLRDIRPGVLDRLQPVAIVRNPWARVVSRYRFAQTAVDHDKADAAYAAGSFEAFLEERHEYGNRPYYWHRAIRGWYPQADYVTDQAGVVQADILRQEDLAREATRYFGLTNPPKPRNVSTRDRGRRYQDYYSDRTVQIVADWYARDIETFGFDFDSPATRNCAFRPGALSK